MFLFPAANKRIMDWYPTYLFTFFHLLQVLDAIFFSLFLLTQTAFASHWERSIRAHGGQFDVGERQKWTKIQVCNCSLAGGRLGERLHTQWLPDALPKNVKFLTLSHSNWPPCSPCTQVLFFRFFVFFRSKYYFPDFRTRSGKKMECPTFRTRVPVFECVDFFFFPPPPPLGEGHCTR